MSARQLFRFSGGLHLPNLKDLSDHQPLRSLPVPEFLVIPLVDYTGEALHPAVAQGDSVGKGDILGDPVSGRGVPVRAGSSGTVTALEPRAVAGREQALCVVLRTDGLDTWSASRPQAIDTPLTATAEELLERIRQCGVVGLGGAGFPTADKIAAARRFGVRTLIINGVECEPCITCDDRLLRERAAEVVSGIGILRHILGAEQTLIALEEDRTEAPAAIQQALRDCADDTTGVVTVPVVYPAGSERQLILTLTGQEVPAAGLPIDIGMVCQNAGTAAAVHRAVVLGEPQISRIVTVTGPGVRDPRNLEVLIGTAMAELIQAAGGYAEGVNRLIMGGPMMGLALPDDTLPVTWATNCLLADDGTILPETDTVMPCIRCGACANACPATLLPQQLYWYARDADLEQLRNHHLPDCLECGACDYVCPSHIPLVDHFRAGKAAIRQQDQERQRADLARERYQFRQQRLEMQEQDLQERRRRKKDALRQNRPDPESLPANGPDPATDPRKAAIQAAIARAR
ncbi:MAG: electron transport complex subunit RsxC, partial [Aquisalimonadaceae bacterium]